MIKKNKFHWSTSGILLLWNPGPTIFIFYDNNSGIKKKRQPRTSHSSPYLETVSHASWRRELHHLNTHSLRRVLWRKHNVPSDVARCKHPDDPATRKNCAVETGFKLSSEKTINFSQPPTFLAVPCSYLCHIYKEWIFKYHTTSLLVFEWEFWSLMGSFKIYKACDMRETRVKKRNGVTLKKQWDKTRVVNSWQRGERMREEDRWIDRQG